MGCAFVLDEAGLFVDDEEEGEEGASKRELLARLEKDEISWHGGFIDDSRLPGSPELHRHTLHITDELQKVEESPHAARRAITLMHACKVGKPGVVYTPPPSQPADCGSDLGRRP